MPIEKTLKAIDADIAVGDFGKARDRLHGLLATYPDDLALRRRLGDVYWRLQHPAMADRYWYLEENKTPDMIVACAAFEQSFGNDPFHILLALKFRGDVSHPRYLPWTHTANIPEAGTRQIPLSHRFPEAGSCKVPTRSSGGVGGQSADRWLCCCCAGCCGASGNRTVHCFDADIQIVKSP